eukprot:1647428-Pyramimonas_sp.AAC.1
MAHLGLRALRAPRPGPKQLRLPRAAGAGGARARAEPRVAPRGARRAKQSGMSLYRRNIVKNMGKLVRGRIS